MKSPLEGNRERPKLDIGSPIPGSKYVRAYCHSCSDAIRVTRAVNNDGDPIIHICDDCSSKSNKSRNGVNREDLDGFYLL